MSSNEIPKTTITKTTISASTAAKIQTSNYPALYLPSSNLTNYPSSIVLDNLINATEQENHFLLHFSWFDSGIFLGLFGLSTPFGIHYMDLSQNISKTIRRNTYWAVERWRFCPLQHHWLPRWKPLLFHSMCRHSFLLNQIIRLFSHFHFRRSFFRVTFVSHISGQTIVGLPTVIYSNGTQYVVFVIAAVLVRFETLKSILLSISPTLHRNFYRNYAHSLAWHWYKSSCHCTWAWCEIKFLGTLRAYLIDALECLPALSTHWNPFSTFRLLFIYQRWH